MSRISIPSPAAIFGNTGFEITRSPDHPISCYFTGLDALVQATRISGVKRTTPV